MVPLLGVAAWEAFAKGVALAVSVYKASCRVKDRRCSYADRFLAYITIIFWSWSISIERSIVIKKVNTDLDNG